MAIGLPNEQLVSSCALVRRRDKYTNTSFMKYYFKSVVTNEWWET